MKKILIVEDDPMLVEIYQKKFSQDGDFEVLTASTGSETEKKIFSEKPDLVLLDLVLPEQDGFEILEKVQKEKALSGIKIIVFSNLSQQEEKQRAIDLGAKDFLIKSEYTPQQIVEKVKGYFSAGENVKKATVTDTRKEEKALKQEKAESSVGRILFLENEEAFLDMFGAELKKAGFEVDGVSDEQTGLAKAEEEKYSAILINSLIKEKEIAALIEGVRKSGKNADVPILILEEKELNEEEKKELTKAGANEILSKENLLPSNLAKKIKELL